MNHHVSIHQTAQVLLALCLLAILLGLGLFLFAEPALATNYTVGGACGSTIQACINFAANGDTISIPAGTYSESLTLDKAISLTGALSTTTFIHAISNQRVELADTRTPEQSRHVERAQGHRKVRAP